MSQRMMVFTEDDHAHAETQADRVLEVLQRGPATSTELKRVTHRFSAAIKLLRLKGYVIDAVKGARRIWTHHLRGKVPMVKVTDEMQAAYYVTPHWLAMRQTRRDFGDHRCCHCRSEMELHVHHWVYNLFDEDLTDLATLCADCHRRIHELENVRIHFPRYVTPDIAARLGWSE